MTHIIGVLLTIIDLLELDVFMFSDAAPGMLPLDSAGMRLSCKGALALPFHKWPRRCTKISQLRPSLAVFRSRARNSPHVAQRAPCISKAVSASW